MVADAPAHTIFELAPVRSRSAELVGYELIDPRLPERNGLFQPLNALRDRSDLAWGRREADAPHAFEVVDSTLVGETPDEFVHSVLEVGSTCDHYAEADRAIGVQTFEVLQITIEERVLVVPLDLKSDRASGEWADVVHFMTLALQRPPVDNALDDEVVLAPPLLPERAAQPLRAFRLAATRTNDLFNRNRRGEQDFLDLRRHIWKIAREDRPCVGQRLDEEASFLQSIKHAANMTKAGTRAASRGRATVYCAL